MAWTELASGSSLCGQTVSEMRPAVVAGEGPTILAVKPRDQPFILHPDGVTRLDAGDRVVAVGTRQELACRALACQETLAY